MRGRVFMCSKLDFDKLKNRKRNIITTADSLKEIVPFVWNEDAIKNKEVEIFGGSNTDVQKA